VVGILICDDHQLIREGMRSVLEEEPEVTIVGVVPDTSAAVSVLETGDGAIAIVDVRLAEEDGLELVRWIKGNRPDVKVIILTAFASDELLIEAAELGVIAIVDKMAGIDELMRVLRDVISGRRFLTTDAVRAARRRMEERGMAQLLQLGDVDREIMSLIGQGMTDREIAARVYLSPQTVRNRVSRLLTNLGRENRTQLALMMAEFDDVGHRFVK
jgi:two-component system, NarL family, response regulator DevR